jgi:DNA-binding response OmpR family regulator
MKILLVDDDRVLTQVVTARLRVKGWQVEVAHDAMQALMFAMRSQPDAIVLDLGLPGGGGLEVLAKLKRSVRTEAIPVVVVSGSMAPDADVNALAQGAVVFLPKPVDPETLHETLSRILVQPSA